jgi:WD40 repeat protein
VAADREQSGGRRADIAHEALIGGWPRLRDWLGQRREAELARRRFEAKVEEWVRLGRGTGGLLDAAELAEAEHWLASPDAADLGISADLPGLVAASQAEQAREIRALRTRLAWAVGFAAAALVAAVVALYGFGQAREQRDRAETAANARATSEAVAEREAVINLARALAAQAPAHLSSDAEASALLARQAYLFAVRGPDPPWDQVDSALRTALNVDQFGHFLSADGFDISAADIAFGGDRLLVAVDETGTLMSWDLTQPSRTPKIAPLRDAGNLGRLVLSPDGRTVVGSGEGAGLRLWDVADPQAAPARLSDSDADGLAYSPNGRFLAGEAGGAVKLWDLTRPRNPAAFDPFVVPAAWTVPEAERAFAVALNGALITGRRDQLAAVNPAGAATPEAPAGKAAMLMEEERKHQQVLDADVNRNGRVALVINHCAADGNPDPCDRGEIEVRVGNDGFFDPNARSVVLGPDGETLALGDADGIVRLRDPGGEDVALGRGVDPVFSPDGRFLAWLVPDGVRVRDLRADPADAVVPIAPSKFGGTTLFEISPNGRLLAVGGYRQRNENIDSWYGVVELWDLARLGAEPVRLQLPGGPPTSATFSPDGRFFAAVVLNGSENLRLPPTLHLWELAGADVVGLPIPGEDREFDVDVDVRNGVWVGDPRAVVDARFAPDGRLAWLVSSCCMGEDQAGRSGAQPRVMRWDPRHPDQPPVVRITLDAEAISHEWQSGGASPWAARWGVDGGWAFSKNGRMLAVVSADGSVRLWDLVGTGSSPVALRDGGTWASKEFDASPDGLLLAAAREGGVWLWDLTQPEAGPTLTSGSGRFPVFSPDGQLLATGGGSVELWNVVLRGPDPAVLSEPGFVTLTPIGFGQGGSSLVAVDEAGWIHSWKTTDALADSVCRVVWRNLSLDEWHRFVGGEVPYERTCPELPADDRAPTPATPAVTPT